MKKVILSLLSLPCFLIFAPFTYADHSVDFNVNSFASYDSLPVEVFIDPQIVTTDTASCVLIDNSNNTIVDANEVMDNNAASGTNEVVFNIPQGTAPTGWTPSSTYHLECTKADNTVIDSNDFRYYVSPTIVGSSQNNNLINVYFLPQVDGYLPEDPNDINFSNPFMALTASGWFDNLGEPDGGIPTNCQENVEYNSQNVSKCTFDLNVNPELPTTNKAVFNIGFTENNILYNGQGINTFPVISISPQVSHLSDSTITAGDTYSENGSFTDLDSTSWTATVDYGEDDASGPQPLSLSGTNFTLNHQYNTPGQYTVFVTITDESGHTGQVRAIITVNSPIQINSLSGGAINLGDTYSENGSFTDPNQGATSWTAVVDYGDGSGSQPLSLNSDNTFSLSHQYTTPGTYIETVTVTDNQGNTGTATTQVTVNSNAIAPVVGQITSNPSQVTVNTSTGFSANFTDANTSDTHTASWNWGDGHTSTGTVTESNGSGSVSDNHTYTALRSYAVTLTVTDSTNLSSTAQSVIAVVPTGGLTQANLSHTNYNGASFSGLNLTKVNGTNAQFQNVDFSSATLTQSNFSNSNLTGSNFTNANLNKANLSNSNLSNVNFTGANLTQANLSNTTRTGVVWSNTTCPNGQNSDNHNNSCAGQGGGL